MCVVTGKKYGGSKEYLLVYCELIRAAQYGGVTGYQDVAKLMGIPTKGNFMQKETGQLLGEISHEEHHNGRPMLSAVVIGTSGQPGKGFFDLAHDLGKLRGGSHDEKLRFWESEKAAVYQTWKRSISTN